MKVYLAILVAFFVSASGAPGVSERIIGGLPVPVGKYPFMVEVTVNDEHTCGGFIYNADWVVTSASCVYGVLPSQVKIIVAQNSLLTVDLGEDTYSVFAIRIFQGYDNSTRFHDIALVETSRPIDFSSANVGYVNYEEVEPTLRGSIMGWGSTSAGGLITTRLREGTVSIVSPCTAYPPTNYDQNYMVCAGIASDGFSPCAFDEGSPLYQAPFVVGIYSKNLGCSSAQPSLYTRITPYYAWLINVAGQQPNSG